MKTLPALAVIAALAAFIFSPASLAVTGSLLFGAGLATMLFSDYARRPKLALVGTAVRRTERFGLAA